MRLKTELVWHWLGAGHWIAFVCVGLACMAQAAAATAADPAPADVEQVSLRGLMQVLEDPTTRMSLDDARDAFADAEFQPVAYNFNAGFSRSAWWLQVTLPLPQSQTSAPWLLELDAPFVDFLDVYLPVLNADGSSGWQQRRSGNRLPLSSRDLPVRAFVFKLPPQPAGAQSVWIRLASQKTINLAGALWHEAAYSRHLTLETALLVTLIGAAALMTLIALIAGIWLGDRLLVWYALYVGASCFLFTANDGFLPVMFLPQRPVLASLLAAAAVCLSTAVGARMIVELFGLRTRFKLIGRILNGIALFALACLLFVAADRYDLIVRPLNLSALVVTCLVVGISTLLIVRREPLALVYFLGFALHCAAVAAFIFRNLGVLPSNLFTQSGYQLIALAHMASLAAAMALRLRHAERERSGLQQQALVAAQQMERVLESKVQQRTEALEAEICERARTQRQLTQALREQRHLLGMVSHEFRTPLGIIGASTEMIRSELDQQEDAQREIAKIRRAVARLTGLIETCLADDRIDADVLQVRWEPLDLAALLGELVNDHAQLRDRVIALAAPTTLVMQGDAVLLAIAFNNLIDNALKYSPAGSPVRIELMTVGDSVRASIQDAGNGVAPQERELIFERYYRASTALRQPGVGLGLYVVRQLVELHHGQLSLSPQPGGACFEVLLPLNWTPA